MVTMSEWRSWCGYEVGNNMTLHAGYVKERFGGVQLAMAYQVLRVTGIYFVDAALLASR